MAILSLNRFNRILITQYHAEKGKLVFWLLIFLLFMIMIIIIVIIFIIITITKYQF